MEIVQDQEISEPVSPSGQFLSSSILSLSIIAVTEFEAPFDDSQAIPFLKDVFLPVNPRFSSIMVADKDGVKRWKRVEVRLTDHVNFPVFTTGMSTQFYDECFVSIFQMAMKQLLEAAIMGSYIILPTSHAASSIYSSYPFLGDGFSLWELSFLVSRADAPPLPLTFPSGASKYIYGTMKNTSMGISNVRGPMEQMALANNPINGLYFVVTGAPQSLMAGVTSYVGKLRVSLLVEKDFIDPQKLKSHIEKHLI
uniref:O-acyltransferase WSD1 C-terminal domain-containing protein n=1 Tax=Salix viminalis TaxID=40686 RepID=A0A6N2KWN2_SALVM